MSTVLSRTQTVSPSAVRALRTQAASVLADEGVDDAVVAGVGLCIGEALANATTHAYPDGDGAVNLSVEVDAQEIVVKVRDEGGGYGATGFRHGEEGALGLTLIAGLTEVFRLSSASGRGTEISMTFARDPERSSAARRLAP